MTTYEYDYRNRLVGVEQTSAGGIILGEWSYAYDVFDRLIVRTENGNTTVTTYDGDHAWADYTAASGVVTRYLYGAETDELLARWRPAEGTVWYLTDRQGSVRDLTDSAGVVLNRIDYSAFGEVASQTNAAAGDRFLYAGREFDFGTGLYWNRARWYDPATGLFMSQDPIGFAGGDANLSRYVFNAPTNFTDPSGTIIREIILAGTLLFGAGSSGPAPPAPPAATAPLNPGVVPPGAAGPGAGDPVRGV